MRPRDRVLLALNHCEPDYVPFDLGGTDVTGINRHVYRSLLPLLGLDVPEEIPILDVVQQIASIDEKALLRLEAHCRAVFPNNPANWQLEVYEDNGNEVFRDEQWMLFEL